MGSHRRSRTSASGLDEGYCERSAMSATAKIFLGVLLIAVALGAGLALHRYDRHTYTYEYNCRHDPNAEGGLYSRRYAEICANAETRTRAPSWTDPAALVVVVAGLGAGAVLIAGGVQRSHN